LVEKAKSSTRAKWALFTSACRGVFATELDSADVVIALGKLGGGGGTEDETVKLLNGIQRV